MNFIKKAEHLKRYKDLAWLLLKHGRSDLVVKMGLNDSESDIPTDQNLDSKADELTADLESLGPTYIKLGQFLSTRADLLPPKYLESLSRLQDKVEPVGYDQIEEIVSSELGVRISKAFEYFDKTPLASASLGQVHYAKLRDGRPVAVKVQRPEIREQIFHDLDAFEDIAEFLEKHSETGKQIMLKATIEEFRKAMLRELDYREEAQNLIKLDENLKQFENIIISKPVEDYTTSNVLTMDYIKGKNISKLTPLFQLDFDGSYLAEELFRAYLKQILIDGFYHADPHPGNIFLTGEGKLALLDLGMVGYISEKLQKKLIRFLIAVSEGNGEQAAEYAVTIGSKTEKHDEENFRKKVEELISKYSNTELEKIEVGRLILAITKISSENSIELPNELVMLGKTLLNLDKVGKTLDPKFDPNSSLRRNAAELLQQNMGKSATTGSLFDALFETKEFFENLPGRVNKILDIVANNRFTVNAEVFNEKYLMETLKEAANRLTLGLVLAALIIGAALLMRVETSFTLLGYPGIAMIFFLIAGIGGLILAFRILFKDESKKNEY